MYTKFNLLFDYLNLMERKTNLHISRTVHPNPFNVAMLGASPCCIASITVVLDLMVFHLIVFVLIVIDLTVFDVMNATYIYFIFVFNFELAKS